MIFQFNLFGSGGIDPTKLTANGVYDLILRAMRIALLFIAALAIIYIIIAGIQYVTAAGAEAKQAEAKKTIQTAIIGLVIAILATTVTNELLRRLNLNRAIQNEINERVEQGAPSQPQLIR
jgi:hypothetical protein